MAHARIDTFGRWIYVKHNLNGFRIEYNNLKFLYDHSREFHVPVPRPYFSFVFRNRLWPYQGEYLFMTRIHGHDLHQRWLTLSHSQKSKIISQLRSYTIDMRSVKPPAETKIGSFSGGPVDCCRLLEFEEVGPFVDEHHLNRHLRGPLELASLSPTVLSSQQKQHELCATHNDLFPRNIMVDDQLNIVAIVDWKSAGWFPVYWEYCMCRNWTYNEVDQDWKKWVSKFLDPWIEEEIADRDLLRAYPNFMVYWSTRVNPDSGDGYELYKYLRSSPK
ncbi:hypothetical protein HHX47_DHR1000159 [Lentinula edodes]|nr:hypothetical protein HHX47_DHR1000159 [Lentinula edodes]